jgi:hypothetical protein
VPATRPLWRGILLVGWIAVEVAVIRQFSALQVIYGLAGAGLIAVGSRRMLAEVNTKMDRTITVSCGGSPHADAGLAGG